MLEKKKCWCVKKGEKEREKEKKEFFVSVASSLTSSFFLLFVAIGRSVGRTSASSLPSRFFLNSNRKREDSTGRTDVANFDIWKLFFSFSSLLFSFIHYSTHFFSSPFLLQRLTNEFFALFLSRSRCNCIQNNGCSQHYYHHLFQYLLFTSYGQRLDRYFLRELDKRIITSNGLFKCSFAGPNTLVGGQYRHKFKSHSSSEFVINSSKWNISSWPCCLFFAYWCE